MAAKEMSYGHFFCVLATASIGQIAIDIAAGALKSRSMATALCEQIKCPYGHFICMLAPGWIDQITIDILADAGVRSTARYLHACPAKNGHVPDGTGRAPVGRFAQL